MKRLSLFVIGIALALSVAGNATALTIRMGSVAPENSPWGRALNRLAAEWQRISNGEIVLQIFHGGIAGDEADMIRKMRIGQLQAAVLTNVGISQLSTKVLTLSMPLLIRDEDEYDYVFQQIRDDIDAEIAAHGFDALAWSMAGWLRFFSKEPLTEPEQLRQIKMAASPEEMTLVRAYQLMGYQPITITHAERLASLVNGMANAYLTVPILAAGFQWFGVTPYMLSIKIGPAPGAVIMSERALRRVSPDLRDRLMAAVDAATATMNSDIRALEREAIDTMVDYGLTIVDLTPAQTETWIAELERSYGVMLGTVFDTDLYNKIREHLNVYRSAKQ